MRSANDAIAGGYNAHAKRHEARARWHEQQGHPPEWAEGSRRKAAKWRKRRDDWVEFWNPTPKNPLEALLLSRMVEVQAHVSRQFSEALYGR